MEHTRSHVGKSPGRAAKAKGQQSIMSMFASMASKRKSCGDQDSAEKKIKSENSDRLAINPVSLLFATMIEYQNSASPAEYDGLFTSVKLCHVDHVAFVTKKENDRHAFQL